MGRLTGKYSKANPIPANRNFSKVSIDELEPLTEAMRRIGDKHSVSVSSVALNYVICKGMKSEKSFLFFKSFFLLKVLFLLVVLEMLNKPKKMLVL
jgi:hypothetical protein